MKRIVTFVVPMPEGESASNGKPADGEGSPAEDGTFDPAAMPPGGMRVEVIVSEAQAQRIIATILSQGSSDVLKPTVEPVTVDLLEKLVAQELEVAEPDVENLLERVVNRVERQLIAQVYSDCDHVKSRAAARLGINRNTLLKKLRQFGQLVEDEPAEAEAGGE